MGENGVLRGYHPFHLFMEDAATKTWVPCSNGMPTGVQTMQGSSEFGGRCSTTEQLQLVGINSKSPKSERNDPFWGSGEQVHRISR